MAEGVAPGGPAQLQREESVLSVEEPDQDLKSNSDLRLSVRSPASKEPPRQIKTFSAAQSSQA